MASADGIGWQHAGGCALPVNPQLRTCHGAPADFRLCANNGREQMQQDVLDHLLKVRWQHSGRPSGEWPEAPQ